MNNSYAGDQWSHYEHNSKYRTDIQQRQKQERDRQRAAYEARAAASQSQAIDAGIDMANHNFGHMNLDGHGRTTPGPSNTINHDAHRSGASDNTTYHRQDARPTSSASTKSSIFGGFSFNRTGTSNSTHKHSSSDDPHPRRASIKDKVQDVYRRMSNSYTKATDNFSKAVDPYVNIAKLSAHERQRWEAELRQEAQDAEEEKRRSDVSSYPVSYHSPTTSHAPSRFSGASAESRSSPFGFEQSEPFRSDSYQPPAPRFKKSKDLLTTGERAAVFVSKIVDPVKKRRDSDDSDLSFADIAPPAELDPCSRCGEVVTGFLIKGRCQECHGKWLQEFWDASDPPAVSSKAYDLDDTNSDYSNRSSSSSPTAPRYINEEEYMKLAASHRIRRVRRTIYDDPGNPFSLDDFVPDDDTPIELENIVYDPNAIPTILKRLSDAVAESPPPDSPDSLGPNPFEEQSSTHHHHDRKPINPTPNPNSASPPSGTLISAVYDLEPDSPISLGPNPFEERPSLTSSSSSSPILFRASSPLLLAPTPRRSGTPALIRDHSIPSPTPPPKDDRFRMILSGSVRKAVGRGGRSAGLHRRSETVPGGGGRERERDTRFYGFWDDVLVEYGRGGSAEGRETGLL